MVTKRELNRIYLHSEKNDFCLLMIDLGIFERRGATLQYNSISSKSKIYFYRMGIVTYAIFGILTYVAYKTLLFARNVFTNPLKPPTGPVRPLETNGEIRKSVLKKRFVKKDFQGKTYDVIIIGSGIGGLTCAGFLARQGKKVLVLEQHGKVGGCTHIFRKGGFEFDVGVHYIGQLYPGTFNRILMDYVTDGQLQFDTLDVNFDDIVLAEKDNQIKVFPLHSGKELYGKNLKKQFPGEEKAIDKFVALLKESSIAMKQYAVLKCLPKPLGKLAMILPVFKTYKKLTSITIAEFVENITKNDELKLVFYYAFGDYGSIPEEAPAFMHATLMNHFFQGSYYPHGGSSQFAFTMIPGIVKAGGDVVGKASVTNILFDENDKVKGVIVRGGETETEIYAPIVVSDAGAINTFEKLVPKRISKYSAPRRALNHLDSGAGCIQVYVGLRGNAEDLDLKCKNAWIYNSTDVSGEWKKYTSYSKEEALANEIPLLFVSFPSTKDTSWKSRNEGKTVCTIVTFGVWEWFEEWKNESKGKRGRVYENLKTEFQNKVWQQVLQYYPQLKDKVEYMDIGTPLTHNHYIASPKGEIYGLDHSIERFRFQSTLDMHSDTGIKGLYLTGQDVFTCGISGGFFGGVATAGSILGPSFFIKLLKYVTEVKTKNKKLK